MVNMKILNSSADLKKQMLHRDPVMYRASLQYIIVLCMLNIIGI